LLWGSLQLFFWLLIHPSAWRNYVARIDPSLRADFYLAELGRRQWRNAKLRRLLIKGYVVWPLLVGLVVWLTGLAEANQMLAPSYSLPSRVAFAVVISLALGLAGGLMVSVAVGIVGGVVGSLAFSLAAIWPGKPEQIAAQVMMIGLALGVAGSAAYGAASVTPGSRAGHRPIYSFTRQMVGIVAGVVIGLAGTVVAGSLAISMASQLSFSAAREIVFGVAGGGTINVARGLTLGAASGMAVGVAIGRRTNPRREVWFGTLFGVTIGLTRIIAVVGAGPQLVGLTDAAMLTALFALSYVLAERIAGPWAGAVAGALGSGSVFFLSIIGDYPRWPILPIGVICIILGLTLAWWRPILFYPFVALWNLFLYRLDANRSPQLSFLRWHAAFWDEYQRLSYIGLKDHLLLILQRDLAQGHAALNYLANSPQRWAAQAAQIELDAHGLESCTDLTAISQAHRSLAAGELAGPASALLRSFSRLSQDVEAALRQESVYNQRLALSAIEDRLDGLVRELTRSSEPYAARFLPVILHWRTLIANYGRSLAAAVEARQEIDNPYIIGVPLTEQQEIFIGRTDISARIEQLLRDQRRPPLLLYGQRRMGKTSLLNNLGRLLPTTVIPLFVDLQGASRAEGHAGLLYNIARDMVKSARQRRNLVLPPLDRAVLTTDPFTHFDEWLDQVEQTLERREPYTALLALDEFETLDSAINKGRYDEEDVLGMLRHLIQHRPRFKVLLAGSRQLGEFQRWAGYLINVQVIHISYLQEAEARQLIEQPVKEFTLRYEPEASRRVVALTRGHPFLVQLLCAEIVALKNEQEPSRRRLATPADVEAAIPEALNSGSFFFADIQRNQVEANGLSLLRALAAQGEGGLIDRASLARRANLVDNDGLDQTLAQLFQRELIEPINGGYRFQVELIRRSFI
jgi:AAA+ ATPase superfamily predicted ATPase